MKRLPGFDEITNTGAALLTTMSASDHSLFESIVAECSVEELKFLVTMLAAWNATLVVAFAELLGEPPDELLRRWLLRIHAES